MNNIPRASGGLGQLAGRCDHNELLNAATCLYSRIVSTMSYLQSFLTLDVWLYASRGMQQLGTYRLSMAPFGTNNSSTYRFRKHRIHVLEAAPCPVVALTLSCEILGRRVHDKLVHCLLARPNQSPLVLAG
jgi:hypothetical protein